MPVQATRLNFIWLFSVPDIRSTLSVSVSSIFRTIVWFDN